MGDNTMIRKKLLSVLCIALCTSMLAAPLAGCKKNTVGTANHHRDKNLDDEEDETEEETDPTAPTVPTSDLSDAEDKMVYFIDISKSMLGVAGDKFHIYDNADSYQVVYSDGEYEISFTEYADAAAAAEALENFKNMVKPHTGSGVKMQIYDDFVVIDEANVPFFDGQYTYGTAGVVGNTYYSLFYFGTDLDKMWDFGNFIVTCTGLHSPYNDMSGNPDLERFTGSGLSMEEVLGLCRDTFGLDEDKLASSHAVDVDSLEFYEEYNDDFCINIELFNYSYNAYIYWYTYEEQAKKQFGNDLEVGDDYMFLKTKEPDYIYGGIWLSGCYLIDIECYNEDYIDEVNDLVEQLGLTRPASAVT